MPDFDHRLYQVSLDVLLTANVPKDIAETASRIVARDDTTQPDLGRTSADQQIMKQVVDHLNEGWRNEK